MYFKQSILNILTRKYLKYYLKYFLPEYFVKYFKYLSKNIFPIAATRRNARCGHHPQRSRRCRLDVHGLV